MNRRLRCCRLLLLVVAPLMTVVAQAAEVTIEVAAGKHDRRQTPLSVALPKSLQGAQGLSLTRQDTGAKVPVQIIPGETRRAAWILDEPLPAGQTRRYALSSADEKSPAAQGRQVSVRKKDGKVQVRIGDKPVLTYNMTEVQPPEGIDPVYAGDGFIHPLYDPAGREVTDDFAPDHAHQHGLFMAWVHTTWKGHEVDFWNLAKGSGTTRHGKLLSTHSGPVLGQMTVERRHLDVSDAEHPADVLNEQWTVDVYALDDIYLLDIESRQKCATDEPLTLEEYRYGGMAIRGNRQCRARDNSQFLTSQGDDRIQGNHTSPRWVDLHGKIDGSESGVAFFCHPENFRAPQPVRLHPDKPYFCFAPMVSGQFKIEPQSDYVSRYRVCVHTGEPDKERLEQLYTDYADPPRVKVVKAPDSAAVDKPGKQPEKKPARPAAAAQEKLPPNVLFFAVDDLRPELGCYGNTRVKSPNIDRLAAGGMVFRRAYCQQAVCSPSRTSLLTGLRPDSTKVWDLNTHFRDHVPDVVTLPQHFIANGYYSVGFGKIYHGGFDDKLSWSEPWRNSDKGWYRRPENIAITEQRRAEALKKGLKGKDLSRASRGPAFEAADVPDNAYPDGDVADMAIEAMRRIKDRPFFLAVGFIKPHLPFNCPQKYWDLYDRHEIQVADNPYAPQDAPEYALTSWGEMRVYSGIPQKGPLTDEQARELIHGYLACVSCTDAQIGRVIGELEKLGLADNTIIVLWGDHGWKLGEHGAWCKHTNFELDARAPLLISAPFAKAKGQSTERLAEFVDIYPTLCDLAGLPQPDHLQGASLAPLLDNPNRDWKPAAFSQYPRGNVMGYSMRTDRYRYTEWQDRKTGEVLARELYDHQGDEAENTNVVDRSENAELVSNLSKQLKAGWQASIATVKNAK